MTVDFNKIYKLAIRQLKKETTYINRILRKRSIKDDLGLHLKYSSDLKYVNHLISILENSMIKKRKLKNKNVSI